MLECRSRGRLFSHRSSTDNMLTCEHQRSSARNWSRTDATISTPTSRSSLSEVLIFEAADDHVQKGEFTCRRATIAMISLQAQDNQNTRHIYYNMPIGVPNRQIWPTFNKLLLRRRKVHPLRDLNTSNIQPTILSTSSCPDSPTDSTDLCHLHWTKGAPTRPILTHLPRKSINSPTLHLQKWRRRGCSIWQIQECRGVPKSDRSAVVKRVESLWADRERVE
jgi:hypothetical protein